MRLSTLTLSCLVPMMMASACSVATLEGRGNRGAAGGTADAKADTATGELALTQPIITTSPLPDQLRLELTSAANAAHNQSVVQAYAPNTVIKITVPADTYTLTATYLHGSASILTGSTKTTVIAQQTATATIALHASNDPNGNLVVTITGPSTVDPGDTVCSLANQPLAQVCSLGRFTCSIATQGKSYSATESCGEQFARADIYQQICKDFPTLSADAVKNVACKNAAVCPALACPAPPVGMRYEPVIDPATSCQTSCGKLVLIVPSKPLTGDFGGSQASAHLDEKGGTIELGCSHGVLSAPIVPDAAGAFKVAGTLQQTGGAILIGHTRPLAPATFQGQVTSIDHFTLQVVQTNDNSAGATNAMDLDRGTPKTIFGLCP